jgi:iron complex outermembrane receptor protein
MQSKRSISIAVLLLISLIISPVKTNAKTEQDSSDVEAFQEMFGQKEEEENVYRAERLLVSATKHIIDVAQAPAIASVVTAEEMRLMGARNLLDVLATIPGIGITRGHYSVYQVEIRGLKTTRQNKIKLMIDGHSIVSPTTGDSWWQLEDIALEQVERVEIIRGPGSALYGANAFSGIINVVTKMGNELNATQISAGGGSFDNGRLNMLHGKRYGDVDLLASLTYNTTEGAQLDVASDAIGLPGETDDWAKVWDGTFKLSWHDLIFFTRYSSRENGPYIGVTNVLNQTGDKSELSNKQFLADLSYQHVINGKWEIKTRFYYDWCDTTFKWQLFPPGMAFSPATVHYFPEGVFGTPHFANRTLGGELTTDYAVTPTNTLTAGLVYEYSRQYDVSHTTNFNPITFVNLGSYQDISDWGNWSLDATRENIAAYVQDEWGVSDTVTLTAGLRHDYYDDIGSSINPRLGVVWELYSDIDLKLLYGESFRAPTLDELYSTNNPAAVGNEDLKPEEMQTYEISLGYSPLIGPSFSVAGFYNKFSNKIELAPTDIPGMQEFRNTGDATIYGVELEGRYKFSAIELYGNYFWQHPEDDATGEQLADVPTYRMNFGLNYWLSNWGKGNLHLLHVGDSNRSAGDPRDDAKGYTVVNTNFIVMDLVEGMELRATLYNVLDETYSYPAPTGSLPDDYPAPGRSVFLEARYDF